MFHVGQLVVCVDDSRVCPPVAGRSYYGDLDGLIKGKIYTVRWCGQYMHTNGLEFIAVRLVEIIRPKLTGGDVECPYAAARFRPVVETSLDVFREMLAPVPGVKQKECVP